MDRSGIVPLNGNNYITWRTQCHMYLMKDDLWRVVSGEDVRPASNDGGRQTAFEKPKDKTLSTIVLSVDPSLLYLLPDPQCPQPVWQKLEEQFQPKTCINKLQLRKRLYSLKLTEGKSVQTHCKDMIENFNELAVPGDFVRDEDRVVHILPSLPASFDMLVTALEANKEIPDVDTVMERLISEERKQAEWCEASEETGLFAKKKRQVIYYV